MRAVGHPGPSRPRAHDGENSTNPSGRKSITYGKRLAQRRCWAVRAVIKSPKHLVVLAESVLHSLSDGGQRRGGGGGWHSADAQAPSCEGLHWVVLAPGAVPLAAPGPSFLTVHVLEPTLPTSDECVLYTGASLKHEAFRDLVNKPLPLPGPALSLLASPSWH